MEFCIFKKQFSMDKTITVGEKWLVNELDLQFLIIRKCTKFQSNRLILSKAIVYTNRLQQTDVIPKTGGGGGGGGGIRTPDNGAECGKNNEIKDNEVAGTIANRGRVLRD